MVPYQRISRVLDIFIAGTNPRRIAKAPTETDFWPHQIHSLLPSTPSTQLRYSDTRKEISLDSWIRNAQGHIAYGTVLAVVTDQPTGSRSNVAKSTSHSRPSCRTCASGTTHINMKAARVPCVTTADCDLLCVTSHLVSPRNEPLSLPVPVG